MRTRASFAGFVFSCLLFAVQLKPAGAFTLTEDQPLSFGRLTVLSNLVSTSVTMDVNGNLNSNGDILVFKDAQPGAFTVTGASALAALTITVTPDPGTITIVNNRFFTIDTFVISSSTTDASGNLSFTVGATIHSDADGAYNEAEYTGFFTVTVTDP